MKNAVINSDFKTFLNHTRCCWDITSLYLLESPEALTFRSPFSPICCLGVITGCLWPVCPSISSFSHFLPSHLDFISSLSSLVLKYAATLLWPIFSFSLNVDVYHFNSGFIAKDIIVCWVSLAELFRVVAAKQHWSRPLGFHMVVPSSFTSTVTRAELL